MNDSEKSARDNNATLRQRGSIYGPYPNGLEIRENILKAITDGYEKHHDGQAMPKRFESYFWDIANKLSRLAVCPSHEDSWHDIVGYGQLIEADVKSKTIIVEAKTQNGDRF